MRSQLNQLMLIFLIIFNNEFNIYVFVLLFNLKFFSWVESSCLILKTNNYERPPQELWELKTAVIIAGPGTFFF